VLLTLWMVVTGSSWTFEKHRRRNRGLRLMSYLTPEN